MYGVREYSNPMFIFITEGSFTMSSILAVTNLHPNISGGGFLVSTPSPAVTVFRVFGHGHSDWYDVIMMQPHIPGNKLTQKDNADIGV